jgi:hypothetical protein
MIKISQSAQDRKLEFNLKFETVKSLMNYNNCYYTERSFGEEGSLYGRSFDRVDSSKGYVEGNVVACTIDINQKKSNLSLEEIICLYNKLTIYSIQKEIVEKPNKIRKVNEVIKTNYILEDPEMLTPILFHPPKM